MNKYLVLHSSSSYEVGEVVYELIFSDFGASVDDSRLTGIDHITVTRNETGYYPFFTIPVNHVKEIQ